MKNFLHKIFGTHLIKTDKKNAEKVLNIIIKRNLLCFEPQIIDESFYFKATMFSTADVSKALTDASLPFEIIDCSGIPFIINRYRSRKGLFYGTILGIIIIALSINFIWDIEFVNSDFSPILLEKVEASGVARGCFIPLLNILDSENKFLLENDEYSFVAFNIKGTVAYVELKKRLTVDGFPSKDEETDRIQHSNIVADDNGIVIKVEAYGGFPIVKKGQIVLSGQILISGAYDRLYGGVGLTRSRGKVYAECNRRLEFEVPLEKDVIKQSGKKEERDVLILFGKKLPLYFDDSQPFEISYITEKYTKIKLFGFLRFPLDLHKTTYYEQIIEKRKIDINEAEEIARKEFENKCSIIIGEDGMLKSKEYTLEYNEKTNSLKLIGELVYIKNIGIEKPFEVG